MAGISKAEKARRAQEAGEPEAMPESATVAMVRDPGTNPLPHACDVHPDEVENYARFGWQVKD